MEQLSNTMGDTREKIGAVIAEALTPLITELGNLAQITDEKLTPFIEENAEAIKRWGEAILATTSFVAGLAGQITGVWEPAQQTIKKTQEELIAQLQRLTTELLNTEQGTDKYRLLQQQIERVRGQLVTLSEAAVDQTEVARVLGLEWTKTGDKITSANAKATKEIDRNAERIAKANEKAATESANAWGQYEDERRADDDRSFDNFFNKLLMLKRQY